MHSIEILLFLGRQHLVSIFTTYYSPAILLQSICTPAHSIRSCCPVVSREFCTFCWWRVKSYDPVMHNTAICICFGICLWIVLRSRSLNSKQQVGWYFLVHNWYLRTIHIYHILVLLKNIYRMTKTYHIFRNNFGLVHTSYIKVHRR